MRRDDSENMVLISPCGKGYLQNLDNQKTVQDKEFKNQRDIPLIGGEQ